MLAIRSTAKFSSQHLNLDARSTRKRKEKGWTMPQSDESAVDEGEETSDSKGGTTPLSDHANAKAYVPVAEPRDGKTTAFRVPS